MKKTIALLLAFVLVCSLSVLAFAEGEQTGTTTLTAEVPEAPPASYVIHIPADTTLTYGDTSSKNLGDVYVSDLENVNGTVRVRMYAMALNNGSNYIPVKYNILLSGSELVSTCSGGSELVNGWPAETKASIYAGVNDWSVAVPGTYTATINWEFYISE